MLNANIKIVAVTAKEYRTMKHKRGDFFSVIPCEIVDKDLTKDEMEIWLRLWFTPYGYSQNKLMVLCSIDDARMKRALAGLKRKGMLCKEKKEYQGKPYVSYQAMYPIEMEEEEIETTESSGHCA